MRNTRKALEHAYVSVTAWEAPPWSLSKGLVRARAARVSVTAWEAPPWSTSSGQRQAHHVGKTMREYLDEDWSTSSGQRQAHHIAFFLPRSTKAGATWPSANAERDSTDDQRETLVRELFSGDLDLPPTELEIPTAQDATELLRHIRDAAASWGLVSEDVDLLAAVAVDVMGTLAPRATRREALRALARAWRETPDFTARPGDLREEVLRRHEADLRSQELLAARRLLATDETEQDVWRQATLRPAAAEGVPRWQAMRFPLGDHPRNALEVTFEYLDGALIVEWRVDGEDSLPSMLGELRLRIRLGDEESEHRTKLSQRSGSLRFPMSARPDGIWGRLS